MFRLELHGAVSGDGQYGTLAFMAGRRRGIVYLSQLEMNLHELAPGNTWRRAYMLRDYEVIAVWDRPLELTPEQSDVAVSLLRLVGRTKGYDTDWQPEFVDESATKIVTGYYYDDAKTLDEGRVWAERQLADSTVATAVIVRDHESGRIFGAWERNKAGKAVLVACSQ